MTSRQKAHLLEEIDSLYGGLLHNTAVRLLPAGVALEDMKSDLLLKVHQWVVRTGCDPEDAARMITTIKHRGVDLRNTLTLHGGRTKSAGLIPEGLEGKVGSVGTDISRKSRERELKVLLRRYVGGLDARIIIQLAYPGPKVRAFARKHPDLYGGRVVEKVNQRKYVIVRKWHVARVLGVDRKRVTEACRNVAQVLCSGTYNWVEELDAKIENQTNISERKKKNKNRNENKNCS